MGTGHPRAANPPGPCTEAPVAARAAAALAARRRATAAGLRSAPLCLHQPSSDPAKPPRSAFLPGKELPGLFLATAMRTMICWDGAGGPIPAQERSGPFPCEDAAPQPSEAKEIGKVSAPVRGASTGTGTCNSDGVPGLRCLWAEIILSTALTLNHSKCLCNSPDISDSSKKQKQNTLPQPPGDARARTDSASLTQAEQPGH